MAHTPFSGTAYKLVGNLQPWPPPGPTVLFHWGSSGQNHADSVVEVTGHPDGHLSILVSKHDGAPLHHAEFQRIRIIGSGMFIFTFKWDPGHVAVFVNDRLLHPYAANGPVLDVPTTEFPAGMSALERPDAARVCQTWVEKRRKKFAFPRLQGSRRPKTLSEQAKDLVIAVNNLRSMALLIQTERQVHLIGYLAAELRALLYWTADDRMDGYNPLLLRMASKADLPLPVFAFSKSSGPPFPSISDVTSHLSSPEGSIQQMNPKQVLMDIQDLLVEEVVVVQRKSKRPHVEEQALTLKQLISETANTLGVAHYDEDVSESVEAMRDFYFCGIDSHARELCIIASLAVDLGQWVLTELANRGQIDLAVLTSATAL